MSSLLSSKILAGAWLRPSLLSELSFMALESHDVIEALKIMESNIEKPPVLYYEISTHILANYNLRYSPYRLMLKDLQFSSITDLAKSLIKNYAKLKPVKRVRLEFTEEQIIEMILILASLSNKLEYTNTSYDLLYYFCDKYCISEFTPTPSQAQSILTALSALNLSSKESAFLIIICKSVLTS
jgi:hypothetical protein